MSINTRTGRTDTTVRTVTTDCLSASRTEMLDSIRAPWDALESVLDYVARCEESGITMQPGDIRSLITAALEGKS